MWCDRLTFVRRSFFIYLPVLHRAIIATISIPNWIKSEYVTYIASPPLQRVTEPPKQQSSILILHKVSYFGKGNQSSAAVICTS